MLYRGRIEGNNVQINDTYAMFRYVQSWYKEEPVYIEDTKELFLQSGETFFKTHFPESEVELLNKKTACVAVRKMLLERGFLKPEKIISKSERDNLIEAIRDLPKCLLNKADAVSIKQPKSLLNHFGFELEEVAGKRKGQYFRIKVKVNSQNICINDDSNEEE